MFKHRQTDYVVCVCMHTQDFICACECVPICINPMSWYFYNQHICCSLSAEDNKCFSTSPLFFPACSLGQMSSMSVATGTFVRIPDTTRSSESQDCFLGCRCDSKGEMEHCRPLSCLQRRHCMLGAGNKQGGWVSSC